MYGLVIDVCITKQSYGDLCTNIQWHWEPKKNDWAFDTHLQLEKHNFLFGSMIYLTTKLNTPSLYYTLHQLIKHHALAKPTDTLYHYLDLNMAKQYNSADHNILSLLQKFESTNYWYSTLFVLTNSQYIDHKNMQLSMLNLLLPEKAQPITMHSISQSNILESENIYQLLMNIKTLWSRNEIAPSVLKKHTCVLWSSIPYEGSANKTSSKPF